MKFRTTFHAALGVALSLTLLTPATASATKVCIDPGHGGRYSNANANGLMEKNLNLAISLVLRQKLNARGITTVMTRTRDRSLEGGDIPTWNWSDRRSRYVYAPDGHTGMWGGIPRDDLQARANVANKAGADLFVCVHANGVDSPRARGTEDYASAGDPLGRQLAGYVQREVVRQTGLRNRGAHTAEFYVLRWSNMPAILLESGFITNPTEARLFKSPSFRARYANAVAEGIADWLATKPFDPVWPRTTGASPAQLAARVSASDFPSGANSVVIARSDTWADAVTAPLYARVTGSPLLYVGSTTVPNSTAVELARLKPTTVRLIGLDSQFSPRLKELIADASSVETSTLVTNVGRSRRSVARLVAQQTPLDTRGEIVLAPWDDTEACLTAVTYATRARVPMLLTFAGERGPDAEAYIAAHRSQIKRVKAFGSTATMTTRVVRGLPRVTRVYSNDRAWWAVMPHLNYYPPTAAGETKPTVVNAKLPWDRLVAARHAGRVNQPVILVENGRMPNRTRLFITTRWRSIGGFRVLDESGRIPNTMDWCLKKADYRWTP